MAMFLDVLDKGGFLVLIEFPAQKKSYSLFLGIEFIKKPYEIEALFKTVQTCIKKTFDENIKIEIIPVCNIGRFPLWEYELTGKELYYLSEEEFYNNGKFEESIFINHLLNGISLTKNCNILRR